MAVLLFVYGTLRRGAVNHHEMAGARFVCEGRTEPRFDLVDLGGYPGLLEGGDTSVVGEVYEVASGHLARLDAFEEVPELYERKPVRVGDLSVETYVLSRNHAHDAPLIADGDWFGSMHSVRR